MSLARVHLQSTLGSRTPPEWYIVVTREAPLSQRRALLDEFSVHDMNRKIAEEINLCRLDGRRRLLSALALVNHIQAPQ